VLEFFFEEQQPILYRPDFSEKVDDRPDQNDMSGHLFQITQFTEEIL
jgi:hypothetical protein